MTQPTIEVVPEKEQGQELMEQKAAATPPRGRKKVLRVAVPLLLVGAAFLTWRLLFTSTVPAGVVMLSGRIEGDDSAVAPRTGGRILQIREREGDDVKAGDVIAVLDDQQVRARAEQARVAAVGAEAKATAAQEQVAVLNEQLRQARLQTSQAEIDAQGRVQQAEADLAAAEADLAQQQASFQLASFDRDAYTRLARSGAVSERQGKQAAATASQQEAAVTAATKRVEAAKGALTTAKANLANASIRGAQTAAIQKQIAQQQAEIASATAGAAQARAQLAEAQADLQDLTITAPFNGTVVTRSAEPGEVVQAGTSIVTLVDLSKVYLRGFVPEGEIGKIKVGQRAHIFLDSNPAQILDAEVSRVDPQATFTPENTYFRDDRVRQVVGLKLQLKSGIGFAKPGMPADGEILVQGSNWPKGSYRK